LRLDSHTQQETREVAMGIRDYLSDLYPLTFNFLYELNVIEPPIPYGMSEDNHSVSR